MKTQQLQQQSTTYPINLSQISIQSLQQQHFNNNKTPLCPSQYQAHLICLNPKCNGFITTNYTNIHSNGSSGTNLTTDLNHSSGNHLQIQNPSFFICSNTQCKTCYHQQSSIYNTTNYTTTNSTSNNTNNKGFVYPKIIGVHAKCFVGNYQSLITCIQQKKKSSEPLKNAINSIIDNFIDYLSDLREKYLHKLQFYGLSELQQQFLESFEKHQYHKINSKISFKIVKELDYQPAVNGLNAKAKLQQYWEKSQKKIKQFFQYFDTIASFTSNSSSLGLDSKIMTQEKERLSLIKMLQENQGKNIQSLHLLYRASENNFETDAFHEKCDRFPGTVTIVQTQFGYKIGGYTPLIWQKAGNNRIDKDPSNKTFIFSLTHKHKFTLKPNHEAAILQYSNAGPTFGCGPSDIYIKNRANTISIYGNIGNTYTNAQYTHGDQKSWTKFSGATNGKEFKVREWEVYQVKWNGRG